MARKRNPDRIVSTEGGPVVPASVKRSRPRSKPVTAAEPSAAPTQPAELPVAATPAAEEPRPSVPVHEALAAMSAVAGREQTSTGKNVELDRAEIERLAYSYWEARGCQGGSPEEDWLRAEQEIAALRAGRVS